MKFQVRPDSRIDDQERRARDTIWKEVWHESSGSPTQEEGEHAAFYDGWDACYAYIHGKEEEEILTREDVQKAIKKTMPMIESWEI